MKVSGIAELCSLSDGADILANCLILSHLLFSLFQGESAVHSYALLDLATIRPCVLGNWSQHDDAELQVSKALNAALRL